MQLAFLWWLASGDSEIKVPVSSEEVMILSVPPASFKSPVSVLHTGEEPPDEDDPDVEFDEWDESMDGALEEDEGE